MKLQSPENFEVVLRITLDHILLRQEYCRVNGLMHSSTVILYILDWTSLFSAMNNNTVCDYIILKQNRWSLNFDK